MKCVSYIQQGTLQRKRIVLTDSQVGTTQFTPKKLKEALFQIIENHIEKKQHCIFLDCYAGSGQIGLEAISRRFGYIILYETDHKKVVHIRKWIHKHHNIETAHVRQRDVKHIMNTQGITKLLQTYTKNMSVHDAVLFIDPPYKQYDDQGIFINSLIKAYSPSLQNGQKVDLLTCIQAPIKQKAVAKGYDKVYKYGNNILFIKTSHINIPDES